MASNPPWTFPLAPSELALLNGAAFAPQAGAPDPLPLLGESTGVSASALIRAVVSAACLAAEAGGALRLEARPRQTPFGPSRQQTLYLEPGEAAPAWPAGSLEARLPELAGRLKASHGAHEAGAVVHAWLGADSADPWRLAAELIQHGLAQRGVLDTVEVIQFGFAKTRAYRLTAEGAALAAQGPVNQVRAWMEQCQRGRPDVWARLGEQIDAGLRQRLKAAGPAPARRLDEDE